MDAKMCFVCGECVSDADIYLSIGKTRYSKTTYPTKISQLIGDDFMVVVSKEDKVCLRCATLFDRLDKFEIAFLEVKTLITGFLSKNYSLCSEGNVEYTSEDLECSREEISHMEDKDALEVPFLRRMENVSPFGRDEQLSPLCDKIDEVNNNPSLKMCAATKQDLDCTFIKSETFRDCWADQCLKTTTDSSNNLSKDLIESIELPEGFSITETDTYKNNKNPPISSPVCKSNIAVSKFQDNPTLQEVKKEKDSFDNCNIDIAFESQQKNRVIKGFKFENTPDLYKEFECGNTNNNSNLPNIKLIKCPLSNSEKVVGLSINESHSNISLLRTKATKSPLNVGAERTHHVIKFINHKKKYHPILPKTNRLFLLPKLSGFNHVKKNVVETNVENNKSKTKQKRDLGEKAPENISLYKEENKSVLINNIKKEAVIEKNSNNYCCRLCKTEFENVAMFEDHMKQHSKNGMFYSCCFCSKTFKSRSGLYNHTATNHTKKFKFCCEMCGKGFTNETSLLEHRSSHTKEHLHVCDVCGKKFNSRGTYWIHRKWHFDPFPYQCTVCGQLFKHSSTLSVHNRCKHSGERPFKCPYCILTFNVKGTFNRHLMLHTKNYPYRCDMCKRGFTTRFKFTEHMVKAHSVVIDRPQVEKKDYRVAVYEDEAKGVDLITNIAVPDSPVEELSSDIDKAHLLSLTVKLKTLLK